jgi:serpin B
VGATWASSVTGVNATDSFGHAAGDGWAALELTFHQDELSMLFVLPDAGAFDTFEDTMDAAMFGTVVDSLQTSYGRVSIPKFEFEAGFLLSTALQSLGMATAFASADLSGMIENNSLFIDEVYHKTFIAVDELGAEAAAATAIVVGETSVPVEEYEFTADRPFLFLIRDRVMNEWLFFGRVTDPTA